MQKRKKYLIFILLLGCAAALFWIGRTPPTLLSREIEVVQEYNELTGKWLETTWLDSGGAGEWLGKSYTITFEPEEIAKEYPLKERIYAVVYEEDYECNRDLEWEDLRLPGLDNEYPGNKILIAVLRGRILHETATYRWLGGFRYTKERYFVDSPEVAVYELYLSLYALEGTKVALANFDITKCTVVENWPELREMIASPAVGDLIE